MSRRPSATGATRRPPGRVQASLGKLGRFRTVAQLLAHFARGQRAFLVPLLVVLLAASVLLVATTGIGHVAPFFYTLF